jgi:dGTPase
LSVRGPSPGLDLTAGTLAGLLKYPIAKGSRSTSETRAWIDRSHGDKAWGVYASEGPDLRWVQSELGLSSNERAPEAILMDWADDVTYAIHDVEDFYRTGTIALYRLRAEDVKGEFLEHVKAAFTSGPKTLHGFDMGKAEAALTELLAVETFPQAPYAGTYSDRERLHLLASGLITESLNAVSLEGKPPKIKIREEAQYKVQLLKQLTRFFVIRNPSLGLIQSGQRRVVETVFKTLVRLMRANSNESLPGGLLCILAILSDDQEMQAVSTRGAKRKFQSLAKTASSRALAKRIKNYVDESIMVRSAADYLCTLTEPQLYDLYERVEHGSHSSMFGGWY